MDLTRRQWLGGLAAGAALAGCRRPSPAPTRLGTIVGGGAFGTSDRPDVTRYALSLVDLDRGGVVEVEVTFTVHGFAPDPTRPRRAVCFEKQGPGGCEVDLQAAAVTRPVAPTSGRAFYGHGVFAPDGRLLYAVETERATERGVIVVRDGASLAVLGEFPSYGANPHDCVWTDGGRTLVITNGGSAGASADGEPSVVLVDAATQALRERLPIPAPGWNAGHVAISDAGDVVAVSAPRTGRSPRDLGGVSIGARGRGLTAVTAPAAITGALVGESLSVALDPVRGVVGVTTPSAGRLTFWDLATHALRADLALPIARGLTRTLDGSAFVVAHSGGQVDRIDPVTLAIDPRATVRGTKLSGSHLYAWDPRA